MKTIIQYLHKTLQLMMMCQNIKFGSKKISSSVDMAEKVISDYMRPHCDLDLEDGKQIFLYDILALNDASPYQTWLQKVYQLKRLSPGKMNSHWNFEPSVTLTLTTTKPTNLFTRQSSL